MVQHEGRTVAEGHLEVRAEGAEEGDLVLGEAGAAPLDAVHHDRHLGVAVDEVGVQHEIVVIAEDATRGAFAQQLDHGVRLRPQRRHVTEADDLVAAHLVDVGEHGTERDLVGVEVGNQRNPHDL